MVATLRYVAKKIPKSRKVKTAQMHLMGREVRAPAVTLFAGACDAAGK